MSNYINAAVATIVLFVSLSACTDAGEESLETDGSLVAQERLSAAHDSEDESTGNVKIGKSTPSEQLQLTDDAAVENAALQDNSDVSDSTGSGTIVVATLALVLGVVNLVVTRMASRKHSERRERDDEIEIDQLLDTAHDLLFERFGYLTTTDAVGLRGAASHIKQASKIDSKNPRVVEYEGCILEMKGSIELAKVRYERSISLDPTRPGPHNSLGVVSEDDKPDEAIAFYKTAAKLDPEDSAMPNYNLGLFYCKLDRLAEAEDCFREVIRRRPEHGRAHNQLGNLLGKKGNLEGARDEYEAAISADPNYVTAMVSLALTLKELSKDDEDWLAWLNHAMKTDPTNDYPVAMLAAIYADKKQPEKALKYAGETMLINPKRRFKGGTIEDLVREMKTLQGADEPEETARFNRIMTRAERRF